MCPISGMVQFLIVVVALLLFCHVAVVRTLEVVFEPKNITLYMYNTIPVQYHVYLEPGDTLDDLKLYSENPDVAKIENTVLIKQPDGAFNLTGNFLGKTRVRCEGAPGAMDVTVIREKRVIDTVFTSSVATLVSIIYINFGCAFNWGELHKTLKRPIGPAIGFFGQFVVMPLVGGSECSPPDYAPLFSSASAWARSSSPTVLKCNWDFSSRGCPRQGARPTSGPWFWTATWTCRSP
jgi:sodium/bile acid cotransporter 3/5